MFCCAKHLVWNIFPVVGVVLQDLLDDVFVCLGYLLECMLVEHVFAQVILAQFADCRRFYVAMAATNPR